LSFLSWKCRQEQVLTGDVDGHVHVTVRLRYIVPCEFSSVIFHLSCAADTVSE
jgi:hypothetical protein